MKSKLMKLLAMALAMISLVSLFAACGGDGGENLSTDADYKVTVVDAVGTPCGEGIVVKFMQNGQQAGMQIVGQNGEAVKNMPRGDYSVELQFTNDEVSYVYDNSNMTLTAEKTELKVVLSQKLGEETTPLGDGVAYYVNGGCTNITLGGEGRTYYIFTPKEEAKYEVSLVGSDAPIGYYGGSIHYIWDHSALDVVDNKFTVDVKKSQLGGAVIIIGVDGGSGDAVLSVQNIGAPDWSIEDEPWTEYTPKSDITPYTLPAGAKLNKFDLTAEGYNLVLNPNDGFYHLDSADGPLVVVLLGAKAKDTEYLPPFETVLEKQGIRCYFFDDDGKFLKKEEYSNCVLKYIENVDEESGAYPLTEDLMYIIKQQGVQAGWFDDSQDNARYLFVDQDGKRVEGINNEISWLFMCRYL